MSKRKNNLVKKSRSDTFLKMAIGEGESDEEEEEDEEESYSSGFYMPNGGGGGQAEHQMRGVVNPFKMGARLRSHVEVAEDQDKSFDLDNSIDEDTGGGGIFSVFHRISKKRKSSYNKHKYTSAIVRNK